MLLPDQIFLKMWSMVHLKNNQQRYFLKCRFLGLVSEFLGIGTDYLKKLKYLKTQIRRISLFKILSTFLLVCILNWKVRKRRGRRWGWREAIIFMPGIVLNTLQLNFIKYFQYYYSVYRCETAAWKVLLTCPLLHLLHREDFHSKVCGINTDLAQTSFCSLYTCLMSFTE